MRDFVPKNSNLNKKEQIKTPEYRTWKDDVNAFYSEKINRLKENLSFQYQEKKNSDTIVNELIDYDIYMAIAENIGYNAVGKDDGENELESIAPELARFIKQIVDTEEV